MVSIHQQVVLVASKLPSTITTWDVHTGTHLATFKDNCTSQNALCLIGRDYFAGAQHPKGSLHFWTWHKDQVLQRSYAVEPIVALVASLNGVHCAGGGQSGTIYLWEVPSGRLLRSWPAHYKAVTALAFTDDGAVLVSAGEDTVACAWLLMDVLDASPEQGASMQGPPTFQSWSEHTLPITSLYCGIGANPIVITASLDRSCKTWSLAQGNLLRSITFPVSLHSVSMDPAEHALYLGGADGRIFEVSLAGENLTQDSGAFPGLGGAGASSGNAADADAGREWRVLEGHTQCVTCLACTTDGGHMLSGSEDGSVRVWELRSRQAVRVINSPEKATISALLVLDRPPTLASGQGRHGAASSSDSGYQAKGPKRPQPLAPFCKFMGMAGAVQPWEGPPVLIDGNHGYRGDILRVCPLDQGTAEDPARILYGQSAQQNGQSLGTVGGSLASGVASKSQGGDESGVDLEAENERLKGQLDQAVQTAQ
ncbi:WD repeat-containing protein 18 [Coccomyxa sp. Obi]|nr:WD repeat-containing protein 18 [Coccomyxa sp. Obi]